VKTRVATPVIELKNHGRVEEPPAEFAFSGTRIAWVAYRSPNRGKVAVYIDGVKVDTVDLYAASAKPRRMVFSESLSPGKHEIRIEALGKSSEESRDDRVGLDAFIVLR